MRSMCFRCIANLDGEAKAGAQLYDEDSFAMYIQIQRDLVHFSGSFEAHHCVPEASVGISSSHGTEGLQKREAIAALGDGEGPEGWRGDQRP